MQRAVRATAHIAIWAVHASPMAARSHAFGHRKQTRMCVSDWLRQLGGPRRGSGRMDVEGGVALGPTSANRRIFACVPCRPQGRRVQARAGSGSLAGTVLKSPQRRPFRLHPFRRHGIRSRVLHQPQADRRRELLLGRATGARLAGAVDSQVISHLT